MRQLAVFAANEQEFPFECLTLKKSQALFTHCKQVGFKGKTPQCLCIYIVMFLFLRFSLALQVPEVVLSDFLSVFLPHNLHSWHELIIIKSFKTSAASLKNTLIAAAFAGGQSFFVLLIAVTHQGGSSLGPDSHSSLVILCLQNKRNKQNSGKRL